MAGPANLKPRPWVEAHTFAQPTFWIGRRPGLEHHLEPLLPLQDYNFLITRLLCCSLDWPTHTSTALLHARPWAIIRICLKIVSADGPGANFEMSQRAQRCRPLAALTTHSGCTMRVHVAQWGSRLERADSLRSASAAYSIECGWSGNSSMLAEFDAGRDGRRKQAP